MAKIPHSISEKNKGEKKISIKKITIAMLGVALFSGCIATLRSNDAAMRMEAIERVSDQDDLFFIAINSELRSVREYGSHNTVVIEDGEYPEDVRVAAVKRLNDPVRLLKCASWQTGDKMFKMDDGGSGGNIEYKGNTYRIGRYQQKLDVTLPDAVKKAALERLSSPDVRKNLGKAIDGNVNGFLEVRRLMPEGSEAFFSNYGRSLRPKNPMSVIIGKVCEIMERDELANFLAESSSWAPIVAPYEYGACFDRLDGVNSEVAEKLYVALFLQEDRRCAAERYYGHEEVGKAVAYWPWKVFRLLQSPGQDIVASALENSDSKEWLRILARVKDQDVLSKVLCDKKMVNAFPSKADRTVIESSFDSEEVDLKINKAAELLAGVSDESALNALANSAQLFSIRSAAIAKMSNNEYLLEIAEKDVKDCPYDTTLAGRSSYRNMVDWAIKTQEQSAMKIRQMAVARMTDIKLLRGVRKTIKEEALKKVASTRLLELGASDVSEIVAYSAYDQDLFVMMEGLKDAKDLQKVAVEAKLKGVRIMAAVMVGGDAMKKVADQEAASVKEIHVEGKFAFGGFALGMNIEDAFALFAARYADIAPRLYLDGKVLCIADKSGRDISWANANSRQVHWLTLPPTVVGKIVGFKSGSFEDLGNLVEGKVGVNFGYDIIRKGEVSQAVGTIDTVQGETLRYFKSPMGKGEDFRRSIRKAVNQHTIESDPMNGGFGAVFANALEDAFQAEENEKNAKAACFALQGSLQLQLTKNAHKGTLGTTGTFR